LSLSRLNHWLPRGEAHPEVVQGTAEFHYQITEALLPQANAVFDDATALDTAVDMLDPQPALMQGLVGPLLLPREVLATGLPTICQPQCVNFLPHLHDRLTAHPAGIIAGTIMQHRHQDAQQTVPNIS
jgi:hypothetical protein